MAVIELTSSAMKRHLDHSESMCFQKAIHPGINKDFRREYANLYPDNIKHFELMEKIK